MKTEKNKKLELGRELAQQREEKGLTIAQLSDRTKIAVKNITHIENGVLDFLPSAYVKAYLSAIAVELGLDSGVVLRKYYASFVKEVDSYVNDKTPVRPMEPPVFVEPETEEPEPLKIEIITEQSKPVFDVPDVPYKETRKEPAKSPVEEELPPAPEKKKKPEPAPVKPEPKPPVIEEKQPVPQVLEKQAPVEQIEKAPEQPVKVMPPEYKSSWFEEFKLVIQFYSVFIFGGLFLVLALIIIFWIVPERQFKSKVKELKALLPGEQTIVQVDTLQQPAVQAAIQDSLPPVIPPPAQAQRKLLSLQVVATDSVWLRIVYNDSLAEEGNFAPGDEKTWQGYNKFYMRTGNAVGIRLLLDGKDLGPLPQSGVITNIEIDPEGIKSIKKTQFPKAMGVSTN